jgi:photosystem II stability/assembly factor-like uncharacterized protein
LPATREGGGAFGAGAFSDSAQIAQSQARARAGLAVVASPDGAAVWRARDGAIERSGDRGQTWERQFSLDGDVLLGGASPSATVCWFVGRAGVVLRSNDGRTWRRVAFPERLDVVGIQATDANRATLRLSDGRQFSTADGGATWSPVPLQEFPAAPF